MIRCLATCSALALAVGVSACTVQQSDSAPPLTGPSDFAQSITVSAYPDLLIKNGQSQSSITVKVFDASGSPAIGVPILVDVLSDGSLTDPGRLSAQHLITLADGQASAVYTVPPALPLAACDVTSFIRILASAVGSNRQTAQTYSADIRLVPADVLSPPTGLTAPTARFTFSPTNPAINQTVTFSATGSHAAPGRALVRYAWDFADGTIKGGASVTHDFGTPGCRKVTLTVIDNTGEGATTMQPVTVF